LLPDLEATTWKESFISKAEEQSMGINTEDTDRWRDINNTLASEDLAAFDVDEVEWKEEAEDFIALESQSLLTQPNAYVSVPPSSRGQIRRRSDTTVTTASEAAQRRRKRMHHVPVDN
jgi:menaquinone-dependent protoporphyrinogen IX oxidase